MRRQVALMRHLDRYLSRKEMAFGAGVQESALSRYAGASQPMGFDVAMNLIRLLEGPARTEALRIALDGQDHEATPTTAAPPIDVSNPIGIAMDSARMASRDIDAIEQSVADGDLDGEDAPRLGAVAEAHEAQAKRLRALEAAAIEGRVLVGGGR